MAIYKWNFVFNWDWKQYLLIAQVESLVVELDDLAVRQGEEEARKNQKLIDEVEELRTQLIIAKRDKGHIPREGQFDCLKKKMVTVWRTCFTSKTEFFWACSLLMIVTVNYSYFPKNP